MKILNEVDQDTRQSTNLNKQLDQLIRNSRYHRKRLPPIVDSEQFKNEVFSLVREASESVKVKSGRGGEATRPPSLRSVQPTQPRDRAIDQRLVRIGAVALRDQRRGGAGGGWSALRSSLSCSLALGQCAVAAAQAPSPRSGRRARAYDGYWRRSSFRRLVARLPLRPAAGSPPVLVRRAASADGGRYGSGPWSWRRQVRRSSSQGCVWFAADGGTCLHCDARGRARWPWGGARWSGGGERHRGCGWCGARRCELTMACGGTAARAGRGGLLALLARGRTARTGFSGRKPCRLPAGGDDNGV